LTPQRTNILAIVLAIAGILLGGFAVYRVTTQQGELTSALSTNQASFRTALDRIGVVPLDPAHPTSVPNVARNPADVPPPITRTEPTTVKFTLTTKEITAPLANGVTYDFWTFDGTVPGPLRVMEGDTVN
jgi:nitrite reductase (NO-forming)